MPFVAIYTKRFQVISLHASFCVKLGINPIHLCTRENPPITGGLFNNRQSVVDRALARGPTCLDLATTLRGILTAFTTLAGLGKQLFQLFQQLLKGIAASSPLSASAPL
ncbi:hypothetical protein SAMN05216475_3990 [Pseudomonas synxantha]|uniref:Uncharacterized protein n=1 Tax=Pseudomonas synxantha TaxID=47883 RepID=A0AAX3IB65_9PSED|nr:hypothetical protein [Pseudomonas synxantha]AZE65582.1 hypothetical protein C4K01_1370 [Pseudomonas synxantha]MBI6581881.1 hypothetical protein [Pseudomonas synxantha]SDU50727.1 hypothetical protein SAMN05216475_3990 [Pseudomonas synxantha]VTR03772.1 Uncharacterised protein [Pseudomonas synxantha]